MKKSIEIVFCGDAIKEGKISVSLFVGTIKYFQDVVYDIASSLIQRHPSQKGRKPSIIKRDCELFLAKTTTGSLHATLEFSQPLYEQSQLFSELNDLSDTVMNQAQLLMDAYVNGDIDKLRAIIPNDKYRRRIINRVTKFLPSEGSDYTLAFSFSGRPPKQFMKPTFDKLAALIEEAAIPHDLEKINAKIVDARGLAIVEDGNITKWIETYEISEQNFDIDHVWRPNKISYSNRTFHLRHPIACVIQKENDLYVTQDDMFNIIAYGISREDAIQSYSSEFSLLWDFIAQDFDSNLTHDAQLLKIKLLDIVKEVKIS